MELVAPPDAEKEVAGHLAAQLATLNDAAVVATRVPNPRPPRMVRVIRSGGPKANMVTDRPTMILECHDLSEPAAADLTRKVRAILFASAPGFVGHAWCEEITEAGVSSSEDPDTQNPRYLIVAELLLSCSVL